MIVFRPIEKFDSDLLIAWRNSSFVMPYVREYRYLNDSDQEKWYQDYLTSRRKSDFDQELLVIEHHLEKKSSYPSSDRGHQTEIGVGGFTRIEWKNRKAEISFYIGLKEFEFLIEPALKLLIEKGFKEFGFHKIYWPVYSHDPHLPIYKKIFDVEAVLKEEHWFEGWKDRVYLSKLNSIDK